MTSDEQEALSFKHGNSIIMILSLRSGNIAVFNSARELCGIIPDPDISEIRNVWKPPAASNPVFAASQQITKYAPILDGSPDDVGI